MESRFERRTVILSVAVLWMLVSCQSCAPDDLCKTTVPIINRFSADPATVEANQSSTLRWDVTGATSLSIDQGIGSVTGSSRVVSPITTTTYTLTATNACGSSTAEATVNSLATVETIARTGWSFDRSTLEWGSSWAEKTGPNNQKWGPRPNGDDMKAYYLHKEPPEPLRDVLGWIEYDFTVSATGWYSLEMRGMPYEWYRDIYIDEEMLFMLSYAFDEDILLVSGGTETWKEGNIYLTQGSHSLRIRRLAFPGWLPEKWSLVFSGTDASGCITGKVVGHKEVRLNEPVTIQITGGTTVATDYTVVAKNTANGVETTVASVVFPASNTVQTQTVSFKFPEAGIYKIIPKSNGELFRPAGLKMGLFVVIDTDSMPSSPQTLARQLVGSVDCSTESPYREKDGATQVVSTSFGSYRQSSGLGRNGASCPSDLSPEECEQYQLERGWGLDGFSYQFTIPDTDHIYLLEVEYPDDDRRTMGFLINDGSTGGNSQIGIPTTGGVETGDHYPLTQSMKTHKAFFYPRATQITVGILTFVPGRRAAASKVKIYQITAALPNNNAAIKQNRAFGYMYEESGRWLQAFGGKDESLPEHVKTIERFAQLCNYFGVDTLYLTAAIYQAITYPSTKTDGLFNTPDHLCRIAALMAEKYGLEYIPEFHLVTNHWFNKYVMGVYYQDDDENDQIPGEVVYVSEDAKKSVSMNNEGDPGFRWKKFIYNALNPNVQNRYIDIIGELADGLSDCASFKGISSRLMLQWQWEGYNALAGIKYGYDDFTIQKFKTDMGIDVLAASTDPNRYQQRYAMLTSQYLSQWTAWRSQSIKTYHEKIARRIQQAKSDARLYFTLFYDEDWSSEKPNVLDILKERGIDMSMYLDNTKYSFLPNYTFGRRYSTPVQDAALLEVFRDEDRANIVKNHGRAFISFGNYFEANDYLDWTELGAVAREGNNDVFLPSGANEREMYALPLASGDVTLLLNGGYGWIYGNSDILLPFLEEYKALEPEKYEQVTGAPDTVAVWKMKKNGKFYLYVVNKMPLALSVDLYIKNQTVLHSNVSTVTYSGERFTLNLEPYMVNGFWSSDLSAEVATVSVALPAEYMTKMVGWSQFSRKFLTKMKTEDLQIPWPGNHFPRLSSIDAQDFAISTTEQALSAYENGNYFTFRQKIESLIMMIIYSAKTVNLFPPDLLERQIAYPTLP